MFARPFRSRTSQNRAATRLLAPLHGTRTPFDCHRAAKIFLRPHPPFKKISRDLNLTTSSLSTRRFISSMSPTASSHQILSRDTPLIERFNNSVFVTFPGLLAARSPLLHGLLTCCSIRRDIRSPFRKQRGLPIHIVTGVGSHRFTGLFVAWLLNYSDEFFSSCPQVILKK